jgi:hypothetical protein
MIFAKNQDVDFLALKFKTHPGSNEIGRSSRKIQNIPLKAAATK